MSTISLIIGLIIGVLGFLFLFWRRLKEDYSSNQIFSFGFIVVGFVLLGFLVGFAIYNIQHTIYFNSRGLWFWGSFIFGSIGFFVAERSIKLKFFETLESANLGFLFLMFSIFIVNSLEKVDLKLLLFAGVVGGLIPLFFFLNSKYKSFTWYKSGKIGFAGLSILGIFFLVRSVVALIDPSMISFIGRIDAIPDSIAAFIFFAALYNLSGI